MLTTEIQAHIRHQEHNRSMENTLTRLQQQEDLNYQEAPQRQPRLFKRIFALWNAAFQPQDVSFVSGMPRAINLQHGSEHK